MRIYRKLLAVTVAISIFLGLSVSSKAFAVVTAPGGCTNAGATNCSGAATTPPDQYSPGCYTSTYSTSTSGSSASTSTSTSNSTTSTGVTFSGPNPCPSGSDTGSYPFSSKYCYVETSGSSSYTQIPCVQMTCELGEAAITQYQANCNVSDPCNATNTADQSETCSTSCSSNTSVSSSALCNSIVTNYLDPVLLFLGGGVGLVITIMIIIGAIQYITSGGDPNGVAAAKKRIANALIALLTFGLMYALLNFIVPGGLF
jgi:hypothetical protein